LPSGRIALETRRLWLIFSLLAIIACVLVYFLFFVWGTGYYWGFLIVLVLGLLFQAVTHREELANNRRKVLGELGVFGGLCAVFTGTFVSIGVYSAQFELLTGLSAFVGLLGGCIAGMLVFDISRSMIYACISAVVSIGLAVTLLLLPPLMAGENEIANYALLPTLQLVVLPAVFTVMFSLFGAALGYFIGDYLQ